MNCIMNILLKIVNYIFFLLEYVFNYVVFCHILPTRVQSPKYCKQKQTNKLLLYTTHFLKSFLKIYTQMKPFYIAFYVGFLYKIIVCTIWTLNAIYEPIYSHEPRNLDEDWYGAVYINIYKKCARIYILLYTYRTCITI